MEYISELLWLSLWPIVLYGAYKISIRNIIKFETKEA
jgi:hypothetical protein